MGGLIDTEEGLTGFSTTNYLESWIETLSGNEMFFGVGRTPTDFSVDRYLKYVDHDVQIFHYMLILILFRFARTPGIYS